MAGYIGSKAVNLSTTGADINGDANIDGDLSFRDNDKAIFGAGSDLQIYHNGSDSFVDDAGTGSLYMRSNSVVLGKYTGEVGLVATADGSVDLYYNDVKKLATTSTGIDVTGTVTADGVTLATGSVINFTDRGNLTHNASTYDMTFNTNSLANALVIKGTGNVGIGTSSPARTLEVYSTAPAIKLNNGTNAFTIGTGAFVDGSNSLVFFDEGVGERMRIDSSGNVGIGLSSGIDGKLHVGGNTVIGSGSATAFSSFTTGGLDVAVGSGTKAFQVWDDSSTSTPRFIVERSGNVGIGTSSPAQLLHLASSAPDLRIQDTDGGYADINVDGGSIELRSDQGNTQASSTLKMFVDGSEAMRIDSSGNVGIGTTSPSAPLEVTRSTEGIAQYITNTGSNQAYTAYGNSDNPPWSQDFNTAGGLLIGIDSDESGILFQGGNYDLRFGTNGADRMRIDSSGNLLVGKTSTATGAGFEARSDGQIVGTRSANRVAFLNRLTSDGDIVQFAKDGTTVGRIGNSGTSLYLAGANSGFKFYSSGFHATNTSGVAVDNTENIGASNVRWNDAYITNGVTTGSDGNDKQDIRDLTEAEQRVAVACKGLLKAWRWKDAVAAKDENPDRDDKARIHVGIIAQDLQAAFAAEGLDASRYAMFMSNTWTDEETGEERTRMGVRYSELLAFIIGAL